MLFHGLFVAFSYCFGFVPIGHTDSSGCSFPVQKTEVGDTRTRRRVRDLNQELCRERTKITKKKSINL